MKLDLEWLCVFIEIHKTRSVSRAAERLGLAQANASIVLNKLRRHFGDPLFCRTSQGMEPTLFALQIYPDIYDSVDRLSRLVGSRASFNPATGNRKFRICTTDIGEMLLLPPLLNYLHREAPGVLIEAELISNNSDRQLESGDVDLAVGFMPDLESGFYQQTLFEQDFVCLVAEGHPRVTENLTRELFLAEGHIVVHSAGTGYSIIEKTLAREGCTRRVVLKVPSFLGVSRIVAQTELLVVVPRHLGHTLAEQKNIRVVQVPVALPVFEVKQHWHERFHADAGNMWMRQTIANLFGRQSTHVVAT